MLALLAATLATGALGSCARLRPATPEERAAERLRNTTWEGQEGDLKLLGTTDYRPGHAGERVEFRGDSTVVFTNNGQGFEATYTVQDSTHLRLRASGAFVGVQTVLVNLTNGDTLRMLPNPFPNSREPAGEWLRRAAR